MAYCSGQIRYLAAIRELSETEDEVKCVSIARHLGISRAGVSKMLRCMANSGLVYEDFGSNVVLTPEGIKAAEEIYRSYKDIYVFFRNILKLPHDEAHDQALLFITEFPKETSDRLRRVVRNSIKRKNNKKDT